MTPGTLRGGDDYGQVHLAGDIGDFGVGVDAEDAAALGVDGEDGAAEGVADEVPQEGAAHAAFGFGGADNRYVARREDDIQWVTPIGRDDFVGHANSS